MAWPPDSNGSNGSHKSYETNGSKHDADSRHQRDRPYTPISKPTPPEPADADRASDEPNQKLSDLITEDVPDLDPERIRRARNTAKRFYLILLALGLAIGVVLSIVLVALLNRWGLTDPPERPLFEDLQSEQPSPGFSVLSDSFGIVRNIGRNDES